MSSYIIHPQCPVLHGSEMFVDSLKCETVAKIRVLDSSSHLAMDDVCALSMDTLTQDSTEMTPTSTSYFWCNFCPYTTENKTSLVEHVSSHRFGCQNCPFHSYSRARVVQHVLLEHSHVVSKLGDLCYCKLVQSKDNTERNPWHKPCFQEVECDNQVCNEDDLDLAVSRENKSNIQQNEEFSNIHTRFKKYFVNRAAEDKTGLKDIGSLEDTTTTDESDKQLPVFLETSKEKNKEAASPSLCTPKNCLKMSHTQKTFPTIKHLLASMPDSPKRPSCEYWQTIKSNEEHISFPESYGIKENSNPRQGQINKPKCMQYFNKPRNKNILPDDEIQSTSQDSKTVEYTQNLNTDFQRIQKCRMLFSRTIMSDPGTFKSPHEDSKYPNISYDTTRSTSLDSGVIKYIYDENYNGKPNEYFSHSKHLKKTQLKCPSQMQSDIVQMEVCKTGEGHVDFSEVPKHNMLLNNSSANYPLVLDTCSIIKTEPVDIGSHSLILGDAGDANSRFVSSATPLQYPVNETIQIKNESHESDEEQSDTTTYGDVHQFPVSKTYASDHDCQVKGLFNKKHVGINNFQDFQSGGNLIAVNQGCISSPQSTKSRIVWDCGQCEFQSNNYEQYKTHVCSLYVTYDKLNNFGDSNDKSVDIQLPKKQGVLKRKLGIRDIDAIPIPRYPCITETYSCRTCNYANSSSDAVKSHNQNQHLPSLLAMNSNNTVVFYCPENCGYMTDVNVDYLSHIKQCLGSLFETETTHSNMFQASLMLTLRHILTTDKAAFKRIFICVSCNFETNILADIISHTSVHSNSKHVAIRLDPCNRKVTWFCLDCHIPINLMQLKKHECNKTDTLKCLDPGCSQCRSGTRTSVYVCVQCKYQTGCLLMITKHNNDVCKGLYKEVKLSTSNLEEMLHCPRCNNSYEVDKISTHKCLAQDNSTAAVDTQFENGMQRQTRSSVKIGLSNKRPSNLEHVERRKTRSSVEWRNDDIRDITKTELQSIQPKKRKRTESIKQTQSKSLITPIVDSFQTLPVCVLTKEEESRNAVTEGIINTRHGEQDKSILKRTQVENVTQNENYSDGHNACGDNNMSDDYRPAIQQPIKRHVWKLHQTHAIRPETHPTTWVPIEAGRAQHNVIPNKSQSSVTTVPPETENKDVNESEFQPLSMLEWLNTESQRMLKLLKP